MFELFAALFAMVVCIAAYAAALTVVVWNVYSFIRGIKTVSSCKESWEWFKGKILDVQELAEDENISSKEGNLKALKGQLKGPGKIRKSIPGIAVIGLGIIGILAWCHMFYGRIIRAALYSLFGKEESKADDVQ